MCVAGYYLKKNRKVYFVVFFSYVFTLKNVSFQLEIGEQI